MHTQVNFEIRKIASEDLPEQLREIPQPPKELYLVGAPLPGDARYLAVVGSRASTRYGEMACERLISGLAGSGIYIVSGLALGIDSAAHRAALRAGLPTIAFPGSGLSEQVLYPASNLGLAKEIIAQGGTLVSEFAPDARARDFFFPQRNRLMAGLCQATLVIEAAEKSGTLITARMALDYNREVLAVPGPIDQKNSTGTNRLIRMGATPITCAEDILEVFGVAPLPNPKQQALRLDLSNAEKSILAALSEPHTRDELFQASGMEITAYNIVLSAMEIRGLIKEEFGEIRSII